jgi:hypothetical protein
VPAIDRPPTADSDDPLVGRLAALSDLPGVREASDAAREACTALRFHEALRRRIPEAAAESRVRGAQASAALDGSSVPVGVVRELVSGARQWPDPLDPGLRVVRGAVAATSESERVVAMLRTAPLQALARLHVVAAAGVVDDDQLGRPRLAGEGCDELVDLGPAPHADAVAARLRGLAQLVTVALSQADRVAAPVVSALVHAEVAGIRPFVRGNALVARALERCLVQASGLDATGVSVPEAGHLHAGGPAYLGSLTAYTQGGAAGVALWLRSGVDALTAGAAEGVRICDAVRAGRLT